MFFGVHFLSFILLWFTGQGQGDWNNCPLQVNIREIKSKKALFWFLTKWRKETQGYAGVGFHLNSG